MLDFMIHEFAVDFFPCFIVYTQFHVFLFPFWVVLIPKIECNSQKIKLPVAEPTLRIYELGNLIVCWFTAHFLQLQPVFHKHSVSNRRSYVLVRKPVHHHIAFNTNVIIEKISRLSVKHTNSLVLTVVTFTQYSAELFRKLVLGAQQHDS